MRVAFIVDSPFRDIPSTVLVAQRLCQEGITAFLVPYNLRWSEIPALAPDFVLLNQMHRTNEAFVNALASTGIPFGILDKEGGVLPSIETYADAMGADQGLRDQAQFFCSWGSLLADFVLRTRRYSPKQVKLTGTPRSDFYAPMWRPAALEASRFVEGFGPLLVLINGNFPTANPIGMTTERVVTDTARCFDQDVEELLQIQRRERHLMEELAALANRLAREFPGVNFVYRPHPFERMDTYDRLLIKQPNLHLVKTGTVEGWILRAKAVIQKNCTTGVEAGMAGIPSLSPAWIPDAVKIPAVESVSVPCPSEEELIRCLRSILEDSFSIPSPIQGRLNRVISEWFHQVDGLSHERVAACILESLGNGKGARVRLNRCKELAYGLDWPGASFKSQALGRLRLWCGLPVEWSFHRRSVVPDKAWETTDKYFDDTHVRRVSQALARLDSKLGASGQRKEVGVRLARERRDYRFPLVGRSVTLFPELRCP